MKKSHIINARNAFIRQFLDQGAKYLGRLDKEDVSEEGLKFYATRITGKELLIEYHIFEINELPAVMQWRLVSN